MTAFGGLDSRLRGNDGIGTLWRFEGSSLAVSKSAILNPNSQIPLLTASPSHCETSSFLRVPPLDSALKRTYVHNMGPKRASKGGLLGETGEGETRRQTSADPRP